MLRRFIILLGMSLIGGMAVGQVTDLFQGKYEGTFARTGREGVKATAALVVEGDGVYRLMISALPEGGAMVVELPGKGTGEKVSFAGRSMGVEWLGDLGTSGSLHVWAADVIYGDEFILKKSERESPTLGMAPPEGAVVLLGYKKDTPPDVSGWTQPDWKALPDGSMQVGKKSNVTKQKFHDYSLHVEFWIPIEAKGRGQGRGNSGVYLNERYECQVLDSFGLPARGGDAGAVYRISAPLVNANLPPERWQTYDIHFKAPRLDAAGKVTAPGEITAKLNGVVVQEGTKISDGTGSSLKEGNLERGGIMLQNHAHPVKYRNIWLVPDLEEK